MYLPTHFPCRHVQSYAVLQLVGAGSEKKEKARFRRAGPRLKNWITVSKSASPHTSSTKLPEDKKEKKLMAPSGAEKEFINSAVFIHHERQKENPVL